MTGTYRIGGQTIRIVSLYEEVHRLCRDYRADGEPDFTVETAQTDLDYERTRAEDGWPDAYLETLAVYRRIAEEMPERDTVLMHGSAVALDGQAYLFTAKSGTGKSTHAKLWLATTKARHVYTDVTYGENDYIMFGKESAGIPEEILMEHEKTTIRIPMLEAARSLNLSNSVAIVLYEAMRQQGFPGMLREGQLHHHQWE